MPEVVTKFRVFLASPNDVPNERNIVKKIIDEFNSTYSNDLNCYIQLLNWENSTYPSFGEYPQKVINNQIGDYDIFIGILWGKFGTPTPKHASGTEEEFNIAYEKYNQKKQGEFQIMLYFNLEAIPMDDIDPEQIKKVKLFREKISSLGYYSTYNSQEHFETIFRTHIYSMISEWGKNNEANSQTAVSIISSELPEETIVDIIEDELGLLDYQEIFLIKINNSTDAMNKITERTDKFNEIIIEKTSELTSVNNSSLPPQLQNNSIKTILAKTSREMLNFVAEIEPYEIIWYNSFSEGMDGIKNILDISEDTMQEEDLISLSTFKTELNVLLETIENVYNNQCEYLSTIRSLPKLTQAIINAKKKMISHINKTISDYQKAIVMIKDIIDIIDNKISLLEEKNN